MTREEALEIIKLCEGWNIGQRSISFLFSGVRTSEDDILDERRGTLLEAWRTLRTSTETAP